MGSSGFPLLLKCNETFILIAHESIYGPIKSSATTLFSHPSRIIHFMIYVNGFTILSFRIN